MNIPSSLIALLLIGLSTVQAIAGPFDDQFLVESGAIDFGGGGALSYIAKHDAPNRVKEFWENKRDDTRCGKVAIKEKACKRLQQEAAADCSFTKAEIKYMQDQNIAPQCDSEIGIISICPCGCFEVGTLITTGSNEVVPVEELTRQDSVIALSPDAAMNRLAFESQGISYVTSGEEDNDLYVLSVSSPASDQQATIGLTMHHGVLLATGEMTTAKDIKIGDRLVFANGEFGKVDRIDRKATSGKVYNFLTSASSDRTDVFSHMVIANGLIVGDLSWQNTHEDLLRQVLIRESN